VAGLVVAFPVSSHEGAQKMTNRLQAATSFLLAIGLFVAGCSSAPKLRGDEKINVSGTVTFANGKPVKNVTLNFFPTDNAQFPVSVVLKVNGGANSGHTAGGIKLNLLPAGVVEPDIAHLCIGSGVVADPRKFFWDFARAKGYAVFCAS
jgi:hypothetical protein